MKYRIVILYVVLSIQGLHAQVGPVPVLERAVSASLDNVPLQVILDTIARQGKFVFSYSGDAIRASRSESIHVQNKSVRYTLNLLFRGEVTYKVRGRYVILHPDDHLASSNRKQIVEGYVYDSGSGRKLSQATVYDRDHLLSSITDKYGYFRIELPDTRNGTAVYFSKEGYLDTLLQPHPVTQQYIEIELSPDRSGAGMTDTLATGFTQPEGQINPPRWLVPRRILVNAGNLTDTLFRNVQFSLLPFIGTNKLLTGNVTNNVSINLIAGYVQGVSIVEVGGGVNIVRNNAGVCQVAGAGNIVGHTFRGVQAAGVWNIDRMMEGVQAAGVVNIVRKDAGICQLGGAGNITGGDFRGFQAAGAWNTAGTLNGVQTAGAFNIVRSDAGLCQVAGVGNITGGSFRGVQAAGVLNGSGTLFGVQVAGVVNSANNVTGLQLSGVINYAAEVTGGQVSGLLNRAKVVNGFQLGVINLTDSCNGIPVGIFSYVKTGYFNIELSADEVFYTNLAVRSGIGKLHNILLIGFRPDDFNSPLWSLGYGVGTTFGNSGRFRFDIDVIAQQVIRRADFREKNQLFKLYVGVDKKISSGCSVAAGITQNFYVSEPGNPDYETNYAGIIPYTFSDKTYSNGTNLKYWPGVKLAVRFYTRRDISN